MRENIIRLICLILVIVNQAFVASGKINFQIEEEQLYKVISLIMTVVVSGWCYWKDNPFTKEAKAGNELMNKLKEKK